MRQFNFGKYPPRLDARTLRFGSYVTSTLQAPFALRARPETHGPVGNAAPNSTPTTAFRRSATTPVTSLSSLGTSSTL